NARLHEDVIHRERFQRDIELGEQVQRSFLPQRLPEVPGYQFYAQYKSALTIGGDYYDFVALPGGRLGVLLGDVAGKGVPAALLMAKLSAEARYCMLMAPDEPAKAVACLFEFQPGASLLLYTDGVTDAMNGLGQPFALDGIHRALLDKSTNAEGPFRPDHIGRQVFDSVRRHSTGRAQNDDIAIVCFGR